MGVFSLWSSGLCVLDLDSKVISELFLDGPYLKDMFIGYANFYQVQDLVFTAVHLFAASDLFRL